MANPFPWLPAALPKTRCARHSQHPPTVSWPSNATRPWPACRPAPWSPAPLVFRAALRSNHRRHRLVIAPGKISRLDKCPRQILIAAFAVVPPFALVIPGPPRVHRAAITGEISRAGKPSNLAHFQRDGHPARTFRQPVCL